MATELGEKVGCFAVISDTHVNPDENHCNSPFPVNARANPRFRHVVAELNQRQIDFVVHLGDLVHPVPDAVDLYGQAAEAYRQIASDLDVPIYTVPGNHDIGDTPIKGAPAGPTTKPMIDVWTKEFGAQMQAFTKGDIRYILLNAQLINSGLPDEQIQRVWLEKELAAANGGRIMLMLHHPVYLCYPDEPDHYDNTNPPGRKWLLDLVKNYKIEAMFCGHAHNFWYHRFHDTDYYMAPATSFVRQDYSEMLRVTPPEDSEHGRDDKAKLGYFIVNVYSKGHSVQIVRTYGAEQGPEDKPAKVKALAPTPRENHRPKIGFDLRQNWAEISEVAPSGGLDEFDRKEVRNDYPLLGLIEMGVRDIRIPLADLRDPARRDRLAALKHLGLRPTIFCFGIPEEKDLALIETASPCITDWEMTIEWNDLDQLRPKIAKVYERTGLPVYLSRMHTKTDLPRGSVYYHVINHGFSVRNVDQLDEVSTLADIGVQGAVFRLANDQNVEKTLLEIDGASASRGIAASVHFRVAGYNPAIPHTDNDTTRSRLSKVIEMNDQLKATRVFCDTLVDQDRGYFVRNGALARNGNPNALFQVVRAGHIINR